MSFNDLTKNSAELDKEKTDKDSAKDNAKKAPSAPAGKPDPKA